MISFNEQIDAEFRKLGFDNAKEILAEAGEILGITFAAFEVPVKDTQHLGYETVSFHFTLMEPCDQWPTYLQMIRAAKGRNDDFKEDDDRTTIYSSRNDPRFQTKDEMIADLKLVEEARQQQRRAAYVSLLFGRKKRASQGIKKGKGKPKG